MKSQESSDVGNDAMAFSERSLQAIRDAKLEAQTLLGRDPSNSNMISIVALIDKLLN